MRRYLDVEAECDLHGPTKLVIGNEWVYCEECMDAVRDGRAYEVFSVIDGKLCTPTVHVLPKEPVNFITIKAKVVGKEDAK
jgi:hypothetical protein